MTDNYLEILTESLRKKIAVLDEIAKYNNEQKEMLQKPDLSMEELDENMEQKDALIHKLVDLDKGFESLYERIRVELLNNKDAHKTQIKNIQDLISVVTEKGVSIQAQEARNKQLIEEYFARERRQISQGRKSSKAAYGYYKNMSNSNVVPPQFMDQKN